MKISYFVKKLSVLGRIFPHRKVWLPGLLIMLSIGFVSASITGFIMYLIHRYMHFYLVIAFPMFAGVPPGFCLLISNVFGKCRSNVLMAILGIFIGFYGYAFYHFMHYCENHDEIEQAMNSANAYVLRFKELGLRKPDIASELVNIIGEDNMGSNEIKLTFWSYLKFRSRVGTKIKKIDPLSFIKGRSKKNRLEKGFSWWFLFFFEAVCFSVFPVFFGFISAYGSFCEKCNEWTESQTICSGYTKQPYRAKELALEGDMYSLLLFTHEVIPIDQLKSRINQQLPDWLKKSLVKIELSYCPKCKSTGYLSVRFGDELLVDDMPLTTDQIKSFEGFIPSARE